MGDFFLSCKMMSFAPGRPAFLLCALLVVEGCSTVTPPVITGDSGADTDTDSDVDTDTLQVKVFSGANHTCAVLDPGNVRCWGLGNLGQLGYGNTENIGDDETPASAGDVDVGGTVVQIAGGGHHTCALLDTGKVRCWGAGWAGQLGYGNTENIGDDETPASAGDVDVGGTVVQITAGYVHTCALLDTGNVRCWGGGDGADDNCGQLGYVSDDVAIGDNETPASAGDVDVGGAVIQVAAGSHHTCALKDTGDVVCWGYGLYGRLGYGSHESIGDDEHPSSAGTVNVGGKVVQITAGGGHTCALLDTGNVRCWGGGHEVGESYGQLGYGNTEAIGDDELPYTAGDVDVGGPVARIGAGANTCALLDSGGVRCWGMGGILGYGNMENIGDDETPASAGDIDIGGNVVQMSVGGGSTCVSLDTGGVRCWGVGMYGALGYGNTEYIGDDETPASAGDVPF